MWGCTVSFISFKNDVGFSFTSSMTQSGFKFSYNQQSNGLMWPRFLRQCHFCSFCVWDRAQEEASSSGTQFSVSVKIIEASSSLVFPMTQQLFQAPLYRWGTWGLERLSSLLVQGHTVRNSRVRTWTQALLTPKPVYLLHTVSLSFLQILHLFNRKWFP